MKSGLGEEGPKSQPKPSVSLYSLTLKDPGPSFHHEALLKKKKKNFNGKQPRDQPVGTLKKRLDMGN